MLDERPARWKERVGTAQALAKAGVRFAFSSDGLAKPETFHAQVRKVIAAGLAAEAAVDAADPPRRRDRRPRPTGSARSSRASSATWSSLTGPYGDETAKRPLRPGRRPEVRPRRGRGPGPARPTARRRRHAPRSRSPSRPGQRPARRRSRPRPSPGAPRPSPTGHGRRRQHRRRRRDGRPDAPTTTEDQPPETPFVDVATELDDDRKPEIQTGGNVLIKDATILTVTQGTIAKGSILVENGKIAAVGPDVHGARRASSVIDAAGLVAMPGIIDTHSHIAIQGGVNECSLSIVPEVRVKDVVTGDDLAIYRALAGGTTTARLLHGSANTIGGQDAVIKLTLRQAGPRPDHPATRRRG